MKGLSLFSGIGGLDLAAMSVGIEPVAMCEIEPFPVQILKKRFPGVPVLPDVRKVNGHDYRGTVDIIFGGFPCQDLSVAGRKAGLIDREGNVTRSGLWFEMLRIISEARPRFVVAENVRGAINAALDTVTRGLAGGATKSGQSSYLHLRLVRHIRESESSSSACGKMWPTPTRRDYKGGAATVTVIAKGRNPMTNNLTDAVQAASGGRQT